VRELLQKTLDEEGATDKKLTKLASSINIAAKYGSDSSLLKENK
jgi:ferritin-like metal-binding protein YciE